MHLRFDRSSVPVAPAAVVRLVALCLALAASAAAQNENNQPAEPPVPPPSPYSLSGVVLNSVTGEPVRRALVQVAGPPVTTTALTLLTDSEGHFQFADLPESDVTLVARKPGFFSEQELHPENYQPSIVHLGENTPSMVLKLVPESSISGHVATVKGEPLEDTPVKVFLQRIIDGRKLWEQRQQAIADEDGQFHIANLQPGRYLLATGPNLGLSGSAAPGARTVRQEGFGTLFFPGVPEVESATMLSVGAGQQVQADFAVRPEPVFKVSGAIAGSKLSGTLQLKTRSGEILPWSGRFDPQTGKFESRIAAGSYVLQFRTADPTGHMIAADLPLIVSSDVTGVILIPGPAPALAIHIEQRPSVAAGQDRGGENTQAQLGEGVRLPDQVTFIGPQLPCPQIRLIPNGAGPQEETLQADLINNQPSSFAVHNLVPGKYSVEIVCNSPWYVQSATIGTVDVLRDELVISAGRRPDPLEVVLRDDGANLMGSLRVEGEPARGSVLLIAEQASLTHAKLIAAAPTGEFGIAGVAPGDYKLLGFDSVDGLEFRNPDVLAPYLSKAVRVTLQAREQATATVERVGMGK
jgi:Carboxypeptidase regulatory-like domain